MGKTQLKIFFTSESDQHKKTYTTGKQSHSKKLFGEERGNLMETRE